MALCMSPALMEDCAAVSLLVNAPEMPELSMHEAACMLEIALAMPGGVGATMKLTTVE